MPSVNEPTVSVHGVPQSQYNAGSVPTPNNGGGIKGWLQNNWVYIALGLGAVTLFLMWRNSNSSNTNNSGGTYSVDPSTGLPANYGSQLDADLQQVISNQNQLLGILNGQNNTVNNPPSNPPPSGSPTPPVNTIPNLGIPPPVQGPFQPRSTVTSAPPNTGTKQYTVVGGDTLWGIAQKDGFANWQQLYNFHGNAQTIQRTAQQHGQWNPSDPGHWIYPGEVLQVH